MDISYNWLKDLVETDLSPQKLAERLTSAGLTVEGIKDAQDDFVFDIDLTSKPFGLSFSSWRGTRNLGNSRFKIQDSRPNIQGKFATAD